MQCSRCGIPVNPEDKFCSSCGSPIEQVAQSCPACQLPVDQSMHFCMSCGTPLTPAPTAVPAPAMAGTAVVPPPAPGGAVPGVSGVPGIAAPAPGQPQPPRPGQPGQSGNPSQSKGEEQNKKTAIIVGIVVVVILACVLGWWLIWGPSKDDSSSQADTAADSQAQSATSDKDSKNDDAKNGSANDDSDKEEKAASCNVVPEASVDNVSGSGTTMIVKLYMSDDACKNSEYKQSDVRVNLKDGSGDVVAAAIYDFAKKPIKFENGEASYTLAFSVDQYWRPIDQTDASDIDTVLMQTNQKPDGKAAVDVGGALGGTNIPASDRDTFAQFALDEQLSHDSSDAYDFYSTYTTQLSSKKFGMEINGKTWNYADIYRHFLKLQNKHPHALLIWAADYPNYTQHGHPADYYVILSGEGFSTAKAAENWCSANGYGREDCMPVDLESDD